MAVYALVHGKKLLALADAIERHQIRGDVLEKLVAKELGLFALASIGILALLKDFDAATNPTYSAKCIREFVYHYHDRPKS